MRFAIAGLLLSLTVDAALIWETIEIYRAGHCSWFFAFLVPLAILKGAIGEIQEMRSDWD